jgi:CRP-like cAMP-binding protein
MTRTDHISVFKGAAGSEPFASDELVLQAWSEADWNRLFDHTQPRPYRASEVIIQRSAVDRALYLVVAGALEVGINQVDGVSMSTLAQIHAGSVVGEQSFFDGLPRSANVWGVSDGELLRLDLEDFRRFGTAEPGLARDLLFALARVLSARLRNTTMRVRR